MSSLSKLRRAYGLRLVKEPLLQATKVTPVAKVSSPAETYAFMAPFVAQEFAESFWILPLGAQFDCVAPVVITRGLLNTSLVHPREVFRAAIAANAAAIVLSHNHPSGDPTPSPEDIQVTRGLVAAGKVIAIDVVDHIVMGNNGRYFSFAEHSMI